MSNFSSRFTSKSGGQMSFAARIERNDALVYDLRVTKNGRTRFFIIKVKPSLHQAYLRKMNSTEAFDLKDYGEILHRGEGEPSEALRAELREKYGMYND